MRHQASLLIASLSVACAAGAAEFHPPQVLSAAGKTIKTESPGYAAPCWADLDRDGKKDLLVGQFKDGKIKVYSGKKGISKLAQGKWLEADGVAAMIPGVW